MPLLVPLALLLAVGCATESQNKQNLAIAAGFKVITPTGPDQISLLQTLPVDKVTPVNYRGKSYYVLPDAKNNQAYVGRAAEYQAYQQLRLAQHLSNQNLQAAQMNQAASMGFGTLGRLGYGLGSGLVTNPIWFRHMPRRRAPRRKALRCACG